MSSGSIGSPGTATRERSVKRQTSAPAERTSRWGRGAGIGRIENRVVARARPCPGGRATSPRVTPGVRHPGLGGEGSVEGADGRLARGDVELVGGDQQRGVAHGDAVGERVGGVFDPQGPGLAGGEHAHGPRRLG